MRKIFKFLSYSLLYMVVSLASAYGVITLSMNNANSPSKNNNNSIGNADTNIPVQLSSIVNNISTEDFIDVDLLVDLNCDFDDITILVNAKIINNGNINDLIVNGNIKIDLLKNNKSFDVDINYFDNTLLLETFGGKFKIETTTLMESLTTILDLVNIELPDLGGFDLNELDINTILGLFSNLTETKQDESILLDIELPVVGNIELICDNNYNLKNINLDKTNITDDISLQVNGNIGYPNEIFNPEKDPSQYFCINHLLDISENLINFISQKQFGFETLFEYKDYQFNAIINADLENFNFKIETTMLDNNCSFTMLNDIIYFEFGNIYFQYGLDDLGLLNDVLSKFNIDFDVNIINSLIVDLKEQNFTSILSSLGISDNLNFDISSLDLSILENISRQDNIINIKLKNIGEIKIELLEKTISKISFINDDLFVNLNSLDYKDIKLSQRNEDYINLASIVPTIDNLISIIMNNTIKGSLKIIYNQFNIDANYTIYNINNEMYVELSTCLYNQNISIIYTNNKLYINLSKTKLFINCDNINNIVDSLSKIFDFNLNSVDTSDLIDLLKQIISPSINPSFIKTFTNNENGFELLLFNDIFVKINENENLINLFTSYNNITIEATISGENNNINTIPQINDKEFTNFEDLIPTIENIYNLILNGNVYAEFNASYQDIVIQGAINYQNNNIELTANIQYKTLTANIMFIQNKIYVCVENIKLSFNLEQLDVLKVFLQDYFNIDIDELMKNLIQTNDLENFDIEKLISLLSINLTSDYIDISYDESLYANILIENSNVSQINVSYNDISATIILQNKPFDFCIENEYVDIISLLDYVKMVYKYINEKQIDLTTNIEIPENNTIIDAKIQLDFTSSLKLSAVLQSPTISDLNASIYVEDEMLYVNYNGLALKINNNNFNELLYILLEFIGIDPTLIPFLSDINLDIDFSELVPEPTEIKLDDIFNMIKIIKTFEESNGTLTITLDGTSLFNNNNASDLIIKVITQNKEIQQIIVNNIYLNNDLSKSMNIIVNLNEWTQFVGVDKNINYIDISGANELVKALINMINGKDFNLKGSLNILGNLVGINISWNVPYDVKLKIVDGSVEGYAVIGEIPTMIGINNDVPYKSGDTESGSDRYLYIYIKDNYIYLYRSEYVDIMFGISKRHYEKCVKISVDTFLANPMYFVQYGIGFTDSIMEAIQTAMDKAANRTEPIDYGNIIKSFSVQNDTNFTTQLNMAEIANNTDLDSLTLTISLSKDLNNKNYISNINFSMFMPLASVFELTISSNDTQLINYGSEVDMSALYNFVNNYSYNEEAFWEASDNNWSLSSETLYTINFEENGGNEVQNLTSSPGKEISLPTFNEIIIDDGITKTIRTFQGWYSSPTFEESSKFTSTKMPNYDLTLYAKWSDNITNYRTITFLSNSEFIVNNITTLAGTSITLPVLSNKVETIDNKTTTYKFTGWYTEQSCLNLFAYSVMPDENISLYAGWEIIKVEETRLLTIYDNDEIIFSSRVKVGDNIDFSGLSKINETTKFYLDSNYEHEYTGDFIMPEDDLELHIRNQYKLIISSQYGNNNTYEYTLYQGEIFSLPEQNSYIVDDGTQTLQQTFTFNGWNYQSNIMPNQNLEIKANWTLDEKYYYTVSFDLRWYLVYSCTAGSKMKETPSSIPSFKVLEGTTIDLTNYTPTCTAYLTAISIDPKNFKATSWGLEAWNDYTKGGSGFTSITITQNTTLYACWERV